MKNYFLTILFLITLLFPQGTFASCLVKPSVEEEAKRASLIFIGTATKIRSAQIASAGYQMFSKKTTWQKDFINVDVVTFSVSEAFKGISSETIEIATSAEGDAGYTFEGGTWLKQGQTYLVYAYKREPMGALPEDWSEGMNPSVAKDLLEKYKKMPAEMITEINEFNSKISPYSAGVCGRTTHINNANEEIEQVRKLFPEAKRFSNQTDAQQINGAEEETATFLKRFF